MKVATLNVWNQNYYWEKRLPIIVDLLKKQGFGGGPDEILLFQEILNTNSHDQLEELKTFLGYENSQLFTSGTKENGNTGGVGLVTRMEIEESWSFDLTKDILSPASHYGRNLGAVRVKYGGSELLFAVVHFGIEPETEEKNAREAVDFLSKINAANLPVILGGDLNSGPTEKPIKIIERAGYEDAWQYLEKPEITTWPIDESLVVENINLKIGKKPEWKINSRRVDYIFTKGLKAKGIEKFGGQVNGIWHSDHWGLIASF